MDFIVNESGCKKLRTDMLTNLIEISGLINEFQDHDGTLKAALGDDYDAIAKTVRVMNSELSSAYQELTTIINDMNEYVERVQNVRKGLN